jgi:hypothetical protein
MHNEMQYDMRRMAISLVGVRPNHASTDYDKQYLWSQQYHVAPNTSHTQTIFLPQLAMPKYGDVSVFPNVDLDDAVIHFLCGDLLSTKNTSYGFMTFAGYTRHISPEARSIGILTQPLVASTTPNSPRDNNGCSTAAMPTLSHLGSGPAPVLCSTTFTRQTFHSQ